MTNVAVDSFEISSLALPYRKKKVIKTSALEVSEKLLTPKFKHFELICHYVILNASSHIHRFVVLTELLKGGKDRRKIILYGVKGDNKQMKYNTYSISRIVSSVNLA